MGLGNAGLAKQPPLGLAQGYGAVRNEGGVLRVWQVWKKCLVLVAGREVVGGTPRDGRMCTATILSPFTLFFLDCWKVLLLSEPRFLEMLIKLEQNSMRRLRGITSAVWKSWCCICSCTFQYKRAVLVSFPFGPSTCCPVVRRLLRQGRSGASCP